LNDSIFNLENSKQLSDLKTNFEVEKKEAEVKAVTRVEREKLAALTAKEKDRQRIIIYSVILGLILVMIIAGLTFRSLRQNRQASRIISQQKKEVEYRNITIETKQKEILDSIRYARRIQTSLMSNERYVEKELNRLIKAKQKP
jgi:hypothetical protein